MRKNKRRPRPARRVRFVRLMGLERLEDRTLLNGSNDFAQFSGQLLHPGDTEQIPIALTSSNFYVPPSGVVLGFQTQAKSGSSLDPADVQITNSSGATMPLRYSSPDKPGNTQSVVLADLPRGSYTLTMRGNQGTVGAYQLNVFLAGDVDGDHTVTTTDGKIIASLIGSTAGDGRYQVSADSNLDGIISSFDYTQWRANVGASTSLQPLGITENLSSGLYLLPDGTPVTASSTITVSGTTNAGATVAMETGSDSNFDEGQTTAGSTGTYSLTAPLAPGSNTLQVRANDSFGQQAFASVKVDLDTQAPLVTLTSPTPPLTTNTNDTLIGQVTDTLSGAASLQASVDNGAYQPISFNGQGNFSFTTALALDGSADGLHTVQLRATDHVGNVSVPLSYSFTLDTVAPVVSVSSPSSGLTFRTNPTVTGQVTDALSGVSSLQAAVDNGVYQTVSFDTQGDFTFPTALLLDGSADGPHTVYLRATDKAGNVSTPVAFTFTLDTIPPVISVSAPSPVTGLVTNQNVTIAGQVTDAVSGVASLQAALDSGSFNPVGLGSGGSFSFATTLPLDGSKDGSHIEHLKATDNAGNVSSFDVSFTLDTIPPVVDFHLDAASNTPPVGDGHTTDAVVTLDGTTEPNTAVGLVQTGASTTSDATGAFSFPGVALALGANTFTVQATDRAGNIGTAQHIITRDPAFGNTLVEGTRFLATLDQTFIVPSTPSILEFTFGDLNFDTTAHFIKDAFEASLTDANGNSLVLPIAGSRDAFLNISENQSPVLSPNVQLNGGTVQVDLSYIAAGTQAHLQVRLVNNDSDTTTSVGVDNAQIIPGNLNTPVAVTPSATTAVATSSVDFSALSDVTTSMTVNYGHTSFNEENNVLYAEMSLTNSGTYPVDAPLVAVVDNLSDPSIHVRDRDGTTADGLPYFLLSASNTLAVGQTTGTRTLAFSDPNGVQFTYDLKILGQLNRPPAFTSEPNTEAIAGAPYVYQAAASDPDGDSLSYSLLIGPKGMTVDPSSGKVTWNPQTSDLGNETVLLQVDDGHGGTAQQQYTVSTITAPPDRPPLFASTPVIDGSVDTAYRYQATATDPDNDPLTFSLTSGPTGMSVDANTGLVSWTPNVSQLGTANVTLTVADGRGGTATQSYVINVAPAPNDSPPRITSDPVTQYNVPPASNPPSGSVSPGSVNLTLGNGQTSSQTVSASGLSGGPLTLGSLVNGVLGTQGQQDVYTFSLATNSLLYFDSLTDSASFEWSLSGPVSADNVTNRPFDASDSSNTGVDPALALPAGAYTLTISSSTPANQNTLASDSGPSTSLVGPYSFRLSNLATAATPVTPGTPFSGTLNPGDSTNIYQFNAVAGQSFYFANLSVTGNPVFDDWRLIDPTGNELFRNIAGGGPYAQENEQYLVNDGGRLTLPFTGTYTILVEGMINFTNVVSYSFNVTPITDTTQALTLGSTVNGNLTARDQLDTYTFNLTNKSLLYFDALTNNSNYQWSLSGPPGTVVSNRSFTSSAVISGGNPALELPAGAYTLTITAVPPAGFATTQPLSGPYSFRLSDTATAQVLTPGTPVNVTLNPAGSTTFYKFSATAGQSFYFAGLSYKNPGPFDNWQLLDPYGNVLFSTSPENDGGLLTLTATGTYTLLIEGGIADTTTPAFSFNVAPITDTANALTLGSTVNGTLANPAQHDTYTFNLAASALLYFDALTNNGGIQWSLSGPGGTAVSNRSFTATDGFSFGGYFPAGADPVLSLPAGAYSLTISGTGQTVGAYAFRLLDLSTAAPLSVNTPVNGILNPANSTNLYQFTANAGDTYQFTSPAGISDKVWRLIDPYGNVVAGSSLNGSSGPVTLLVTGTYYLTVEGFISDTGTANYTITAQFQGNTPPPPPSGTALTLGSTVSGSIATSSQQDHYFFTLPTNALLYFDDLSTASLVGWTLSGPGGVVVSNRQLSSSDPNVTPVMPLPAGTYILTIAGVDGGTGAYSFRLDNLASATPLTPGTPVSDTLNPANSTNLYQFTASAGQSFYFASISGGTNYVQWRLIDPYGHQLFSTSYANDGGRLSLPASGTYTVLIEGNNFNTGSLSYSFEVAPITDTSQALALGGLVNGNLAAPGQQDSYTFNLAANALLYFDALTNNAGIDWSLTGPAGTVVSNRSFTNSDAGGINSHGTDPALALPAGAYTLKVTGTGQTTGAYSFRLSNLATATTLTLGTAVSGALNPANSTNLYQFNAVAGQSFYFAALSANGSGRWRLIDPYGNVVSDNALGVDAGRLTLTASGAYTVLVEGNIGDTGTLNYSFNVFPITDTTQVLTPGSTIDGNFATPGQQDTYTFTLASDAQLYFDSLTNNSNFLWTLTGPPGYVDWAENGSPFIVYNRLFNQSDANTLGGTNPALSLPAGTYTLLVDALGQTAGAYSFRLVNVTSATPFTPGTPVSSTLNPANRTDLYQFSAQAGQSVYFAHLSGGTGNTEWRLIDPSGNQVFSMAFTNDPGRLTLASSGTYTLLIEGGVTDTGTVSYSFNVAPITDPTRTLTLGSLVNASLASPGEQDHYTFTLPTNTLVYFDSLTNNSAYEWSLSGPAGTIVNNLAFTSSDGSPVGSTNPVRALPAGTYTLTVFATGQTASAYAFRLSNLVSATPLTPGTPVNGTLNPANSTNIYQFQASAGQSFYFAHLSNTATNAIWRLIDPYGNSLFHVGLGGDVGPLTLTTTGTYTLLVEGYIGDTTTVNYSFNVAPITDAAQSLTLGGLVNGSLTAPGELDNYTFTLANNALLYFDSLTNNANYQWSLTGPDGAAVSNRSFTSSDGGSILNPVLVSPAGSYTLTVSATGQTIGAYSFRLSDLGTATALTPGTPVSGTLNPAISSNFYQFSANAGDQYTFVRQGGSGIPDADWRLIDPYGNVLFRAGLGTNEGPLTLAATGTYYLLIEGSIADTGSGTYSFNVQFQGNTPPVFSGTPLTLSSTTSGNLATAGQQDHYTFTLAASAQLYFDSLTNNSNIQWSLSGPIGTAVSNRSFAASDAGSIATPALELPAGNYTLTVSGSGQTTGAYAFRLDDMAAATVLTPGTAVSGSLVPTNSTNLYQFQATAGETFYFARISGSGGVFFDRWQLIDPYGKVVFSTDLSQDAGRITLTAAGTYTVLVEGAVGDTGAESYSFNVFPIADVSQSLTLGNLVNGTLAAPGQQDHYTFSLSANALLYFDALTNNNNLQWSLWGPGGLVAYHTFGTSDSTGSSNPVMAVTAGNYILYVAAPAPTTGPYSFRLSDLSSATPVGLNTEVSGTLNPANSTDLYQFTGTAGETYYFTSLNIPLSLSGSSSTADWRLVDPYGNILFTANLGTDGGSVTLPSTGTYTLLIEGGILNPIETGYAFQIDRPQLEAIASDPNVPFVNQTGSVSNINAPSFNVQFAGNGQAQGFDVQFVSPATNIVLASIPASIDTSYLYQVRAVDPQRYPLTYSLTQAPTGMTIDPTTGLITWVPTAAQVGHNAVTVQVEDSHGGTDTQSFVVTVTNETPGGIQGTVYNDENGDGSRDGNGTSPPPPSGPFLPAGSPFPGIGVDKGPGITITIGPDGALTTTINTNVPPYDNAEDTYVGVVNEASSAVALKALELSSNAEIFGFDGDGIGIGPYVPGGNASYEGRYGYEGPGTYYSDINGSFTQGTVNFDDGQGDGLEPGQEAYFSLENSPTTIESTIVQQAVPANLEPGLAGVTVYLDLNRNGQLDPNEPETQTDALGHYFFSNLAPGAYTVAEVTQSGLQQTGPPNGTYTAVVKSGQETRGLDFGNEILTNVVARPPTITSTAPTTAAAGQTYRYAVTVSNPDDDVLSFDLPVKPNGMVVDALTGTIDWEPTDSQLGPQNVVLRLTDNKGDVVLQSFAIQVDEESPPVITSTPPSQPAQSSLPYQYQVEAQDAQNDPLTYSLLQAPSGMTIDPNSGLLSWVGPQVGPGLPSGYSVTIQAANPFGGTDTQTYTVLVISPGFDRPPVITSHPDTNHTFEGEMYYQVIASDPDGDPLSYSLPVAPSGMTISSTGLVSWLPTENQIGANPVTVQVDDGRGLHATQNFTINVTWQSPNPGLQITSVPPVTARVGVGYDYDPTATEDLDGLEVGVSAIWSLDKAPAGMSINPRTATVSWTPTMDQLGSATVVLRATSLDGGGSSTQEFTITVVSGDIPPSIVSTPSTQGTVGQLYTYAVKAKDLEGNPLTYSLVTAPAGMVIDPSTGLVQWAPTAGQIGSQPVVINVSDGQGGGAVQGYNIVVSSTAASQPPVISSTPLLDTTVNQPYSYQLAATDPQGETLSYSLINAPGGMSIDRNSGLVQWTPLTLQLGPNPVLIAVTNTDGEIATQGFSITVQPPNQPPAIKSSPVTTATAGGPYEYDVDAVDPDGDPLTYTLVTSPTGMTIDSLGRITWSPQIADIGNQPVDVSVSDGRGSTVSQSFTIAVSADTEPPKVLLSLTANPVDLATPDTVVISATDNVGVTSMTLTENGVPVPIDSTGSAILRDTTAGVFTLTATASDAAGNVGTDSQTLTVINPQVTNAPVLALTTPADGDTVTATTQVIGTVQDPNLVSYTLSVAPIGSQNFTTLSTGTSQVNNGVLGTFDPTMLQDDSYDLQLAATNTGGLTSTADITVNVSQNLKLGNFTLSFTDLTVPVSGIPITITRTYDTLNANQSEDFGYGWSLQYRDVDLKTSVASTGMEADGFFNPFNTRTKVYLTLPGGQREGFTFQPTAEPGLRGTFLGMLEPKFVPDAGVTDSLTVAPADLRVDTDGTLYDYDTGLAYNPADPNFGGSYLLTTKDGIAYTIDGFTGQLTQVSDSNNNTLTFSDAGITSSTGTGIKFQRDAQGRIAAIVDPMGNKIVYQYDANGNLISSTDRTNDTTQYVYLSTPAHYLEKVIDPLGHTGVRTAYDADGRLSQVVDANGKAIQLSFDSTDSSETVKDQLGNPTTYVYDDRGNVVTEIDALGGITHYTYDANNDVLSETDPMGRTQKFTYDSNGDALTQTDALGNTTISTYKDFTFFATASHGASLNIVASAPFTRQTSATDPLGNTTLIGQNFVGDDISTTDPLGNTVSIPYDQSGNPVSVTDADGNTTQLAFDGAGHNVQITDALGNVTSFSYDADGNLLTTTNTLTAADGTVSTVTTTNTYDAQERLISATDAEGGVTQTEYDAAGNKIATIDPLGRRTQYRYDDMNRLIETIYADGSTTQTEYDADGHQTATIDQLGRMTQYQYDALGRLVKTIYPDGSSSETEYDADGETIATTDQLGNTTTYQYDADGNQIAQKDPLGNSTITTYNADGRMTTQTDPLGNKTTYVYDADGRTTETDYADGTKTQTTYDPAGHVIATTDQLGQITRYQDDADGRLTTVTDPLGNQTVYTYDALGHLLTATTTQTAADGTVRNLTTTTEYDGMGRVIAVIDPSGAVTKYEYDLDGNKTAAIDPLGRRTQFVYNDMNQLIETIYPDGTHTENQYDAAGELTATIDQAGRKTQYQYDSMGRLVKSIYPDGSSTQTQYDADGHRISQTDELGGSTTFKLDADGRATLVTDALADTTSYTYDADGRKTSETDALGHTTQYVYDVLGRLVKTNYADGTNSTTTYDAGGNMIASTDELGRTTRYQYDADGRVTAVIDPLGQTTQYAYDEAGDIIRKTDANGKVTTYEYDADGRQIAVLLPALPGQASFESTTQYDADGNVISTTNYDGNTIQYVYDALNRLITKEYPDGSSVAYTYTLTGQVATVTDSRGTTVYTYDQRDRLLSCTEPDGTSISYTYDAAGDCTTVTTPAGTTSYTFDALGRDLTVTDPNGEVTTYTYDAAGNLIRTILPNGIVETRSYDDLNRLTFLQDVSGSTIIASYTYTLGPTGLIEKIVENAGRTVVYTYDASDRLTQEKITDAIVGDRTINYTYDAVGNRLTMNDSVAGSTIYTYDAMDRLTTSTLAGQATSYTYDKNGNLLSQVSPTQTIFYQYDFDNRLIATGTNGVINETNKYDPEGNLVSQTVGGQETRFLIDTVVQYAQVVMEYSPSGSISAAYVYGNSLVSQVRNGVLSVYLIDGQQNTRELTNAAGSVTDRYIYDAFGRMLFQSGTTVNRYLFAGQQTDALTGFDYMRARYYDPSLGRFTSADPLRQSSVGEMEPFQFYVYTGNDPVNETDPSGKAFTLRQLTVAFAVGAAIDSAINVYDSSGSLLEAGVAGLQAFVLALTIPIGIAGLAEASAFGAVAAFGIGAGGVGYATYRITKDVQALQNTNGMSTLGEVGLGLDILFNAIGVGFAVTGAVRPLTFGAPKVTGAVSPDQVQTLDFASKMEGGVEIDKLTPGPIQDSSFEVGQGPLPDLSILNVKGMNPVEANRFISSTNAATVEVYLPDTSDADWFPPQVDPDFILQDELAFTVRQPGNALKSFIYWQEIDGQMSIVKSYKPGNGLPPFADLPENRGLANVYMAILFDDGLITEAEFNDYVDNGSPP